MTQATRDDDAVVEVVAVDPASPGREHTVIAEYDKRTGVLRMLRDIPADRTLKVRTTAGAPPATTIPTLLKFRALGPDQRPPRPRRAWWDRCR